MSGKLENNKFEELIRNKLEDYETATEANSWRSIEKSLTKRQRIKYLYLTITGVAAAGVMLFFTLNLPQTNPDIPQQTAIIQNIPEKNNDGKNSSEDSLKNEKIKSDRQTANVQPDKTKQDNKIRSQKKQTVPANPDIKITYNPEDNTATISVSQQQSSTSTIENSLKNNNPRTAKPEISGLKTLDAPNSTSNLSADNRQNQAKSDEKTDVKPKQNLKFDSKNWTVSMNFSAGNNQNIGMQNSDMIPSSPLLALESSKEYIKDTYRNNLGLPDNAESQHGVPLSGKLLIRRNINSRWAVETGLSYTYLSTKYKWNKNVLKQQLHYLGIPVNAVYYAVTKPAWNIYVSAGGMVEKGISASVNRNDNVNSSIKMQGLQFSVNAAVGVSYKLYRNIGMFFEPQVGYFFENKQPESIRTTSPISIGLGLGLRYNM